LYCIGWYWTGTIVPSLEKLKKHLIQKIKKNIGLGLNSKKIACGAEIGGRGESARGSSHDKIVVMRWCDLIQKKIACGAEEEEEDEEEDEEEEDEKKKMKKKRRRRR